MAKLINKRWDQNPAATGDDAWAGAQGVKIRTVSKFNHYQSVLRDISINTYSTPNQLEKGEQNNIIGYSYGTLTGAWEALGRADNGEYVDNLVIVGAPMNKSLLDAVQNHENIGQVLIYNLPGDPLVPPMSDWQIRAAAPKLGGKSRDLKTGHHALSDGPDISNEANRQTFIEYMKDNGVK